VAVRIADDGTGLGQCTTSDGPHVGIVGIRRVITHAGGTVRVANGTTHGTVVEARVPEVST